MAWCFYLWFDMWDSPPELIVLLRIGGAVWDQSMFHGMHPGYMDVYICPYDNIGEWVGAFWFWDDELWNECTNYALVGGVVPGPNLQYHPEWYHRAQLNAGVNYAALGKQEDDHSWVYGAFSSGFTLSMILKNGVDIRIMP